MKYFSLRSALHNQQGATVVLVAILMSILIGIAAFAIDIGYLYAARNELQNTADAAALAATRQLGVIYNSLSYDEQQTYNCGTDNVWDDAYANDEETLIAAAQEVALKNRAAGRNIDLAGGDIQIGSWDGSGFTPTLEQPDAVRVIARRDSAVNGPVTTFFANIFGIDSIPVSASATAALTGQSTSEPGELPLPFGISKQWFEEHLDLCSQPIAFSPANDPDSCAGWNNWQLDPPNDSQTRDILDNIPREPSDPEYDERLISPALTAGKDYLNYIGGELSNPTFEKLLIAFQKMGFDVAYESEDVYYPITDTISGEPINDATGDSRAKPLCDDGSGRATLCDDDIHTEPLEYPDGPPRNLHAWNATVPVYNSADCSNPNTAMETIGFAPIQIQEVIDAGGGPDGKIVKGIVVCDMVEPEDNRGGGGEFGVKGSIPNLVE